MFQVNMGMVIKLIVPILMNKVYKGEMLMPFLKRMKTKTSKIDNALQAHPVKRVLSFLLYNQNGSMTVEAAFAIPFFLFFFMNLLSVFLMFGRYTKTLSELHQQAKEIAVYAHLTENENEMVTLTKVQKLEPIVSIISFPSASTIVNCRVRKWTGYRVNGNLSEQTEEEEWVYITETGTVYHRSRGCSYLNPSIRCSTANQVKNIRNHDGGKYTPCQYCGEKGGLGIVFITEYGNHYHHDIRCSGLKRTIKTVPISQVRHLRACSKCG